VKVVGDLIKGCSIPLSTKRDAVSKYFIIYNSVARQSIRKDECVPYVEEVRLDGLRKTTKTSSQNRWSPDREMKPNPPEYGAGV
jgi:hypothetical protein